MKPFPLPVLGRAICAITVLSSLLACSGVAATSGEAAVPAPATAAAPVAQAPKAGAGAGLMQELQAAVGAAACDSAAQCKTVAIGHKACGGPESYIAYSTKTDGTKVTSLAARYADARKGENQRSGMISNCMLLRDPGATCSAGRCVTLEAGQGGAVR
ncbi:MAG: hypothetical protein V4723_12310 [Pseudomonadota bacterium]